MQNKKAKNEALASQNVQPRLQGKILLLAFFRNWNVNSYLGWIICTLLNGLIFCEIIFGLHIKSVYSLTNSVFGKYILMNNMISVWCYILLTKFLWIVFWKQDKSFHTENVYYFVYFPNCVFATHEYYTRLKSKLLSYFKPYHE